MTLPAAGPGVCRRGTELEHAADDVSAYLNVDACPDHSPAAYRQDRRVEDPAPGRYPEQLAGRAQTTANARGAVDVDKSRRGGYVSKQRAARIADGTAPRATSRSTR